MRENSRSRESRNGSSSQGSSKAMIFAAPIVLGAVFGLGWMAGRESVNSEVAHSSSDILSHIDAKAQALEQAKRQELPLTFQEELTRRNHEPLPPPTTVGLSDAGRAIENEIQKPTLAGVEMKEGPSSDEMIPSRLSDSASDLKKALQKAQEEPAAGGDAFTLQLSASQDRQEANRQVAKLKEKGYEAFVKEVQVPGRGTWFRVRIGHFSSREEASRYLQEFRPASHLEAFVTPSE